MTILILPLAPKAGGILLLSSLDSRWRTATEKFPLKLQSILSQSMIWPWNAMETKLHILIKFVLLKAINSNIVIKQIQLLYFFTWDLIGM